MSAIRLHLRAILGWASVIGLLSFPLISVSSAVDMFLKIEGVKGESSSKDHKGEIDILSWSWGLSNSGKSGGKGGKPDVQAISLIKHFDITSPELMLSTLSGKRYNKAVLSVANTNKGKSSDFLVLTLNDVNVTSISSGGSKGETQLTESVTLDFTKFKLEYIAPRKEGQGEEKKSVEWDTATNTGSVK
jgi:type VI secretion system secreted protein Hcp